MSCHHRRHQLNHHFCQVRVGPGGGGDSRLCQQRSKARASVVNPAPRHRLDNARAQADPTHCGCSHVLHTGRTIDAHQTDGTDAAPRCHFLGKKTRAGQRLALQLTTLGPQCAQQCTLRGACNLRTVGTQFAQAEARPAAKAGVVAWRQTHTARRDPHRHRWVHWRWSQCFEKHAHRGTGVDHTATPLVATKHAERVSIAQKRARRIDGSTGQGHGIDVAAASMCQRFHQAVQVGIT